MKKLSNKRIQGFALILPLVIVVFLIVSGFAVYNQNRGLSAVQKNVLSESDSKSGDSGTSGKNEDNDEG